MGIIQNFFKKLQFNSFNSPEGSLDPSTLTINQWFDDANAEEFVTYEAQVLQLQRRYWGLTRYGRELTRSCVDTRVTWIAGNGVNVTAKGAKENKFLQNFIEETKLDGLYFRELATNAEIEGKNLMLPYWVKGEGDKQGKVEVKNISYLDQKYEAIADPDDYRKIKEILFKDKSGQVTKKLTDNFVYARYGAMRNRVNEIPPRTAYVLYNIDSVSLAIRDYRKINRKFGSVFPVFEMQTNEDAKNLAKTINDTNWKIGNTLAFVGTAKYLEPTGGGVESIIKEILMHFRIISNMTGIPVYFLAPDLMSNRATAQELLEMVNAATMSERENWKDAITQLCKIAMKIHTEKTGEILNYDDVYVSIPAVSLNQIQTLVDVYLPLQMAGIISKKTLREKVPDIDPEEEQGRMDDEEDDSEDDQDISKGVVNSAVDEMNRQMETENDA
jgi:hypothetical protein